MAHGSDTLTPSSLHEEHASLDTRLEMLEKGLCTEGEDAASGDLAERLGDLKRFLEQHFAREENSPFYQELPLRQPHLSDRLARLQSEHAEIASELTALCEAAHAAAEGGGAPDPNLTERMRALARRIRRHERDETEIVQRAWLEDFGEGD